MLNHVTLAVSGVKLEPVPTAELQTIMASIGKALGNKIEAARRDNRMNDEVRQLVNMLDTAPQEMRQTIIATLSDVAGVEIEATTGGLDWDNFKRLFEAEEANVVEAQRLLDFEVPAEGPGPRYCHWCVHGSRRNGVLTRCEALQEDVSNVNAAQCRFYQDNRVSAAWSKFIEVKAEDRRCGQCANCSFADNVSARCALTGKMVNVTQATKCKDWRV